MGAAYANEIYTNMNTETLACAIIGHLVGDYLLQNDWMALGKKMSSVFYRPTDGRWELKWTLTTVFRWFSLPCFVHCLIWTLAVMAFAGWMGFKDAGYASERYWFSVTAFVVLFVTHYAQDRTQIVKFWMTRINRQPKFVEPPMSPWSIIVVDNVWHIVTIWIVWKFIV